MSESTNEWRIKLMRQTPFFKDFKDGELASLINISDLRKYKLNEVIVSANHGGTHFYVILDGGAKVVKKIADNRYKELDHLEAGDCFGEVAVLLDERRTATVVAGVDCAVIKVQGGHIDELPEPVQVKLYKQLAVNLSRRLIINTLNR